MGVRSGVALQPLQDAQCSLNQAVYRRQAVVSDYATRRELPCNEGVALLRHHAAFAGLDVLDVGVGAGRTTRFLQPFARRYEAIDYSPGMVDYMKRTMPEVSTSLCDACDLSRFHEGSFDFVLASNCVIDALSPRDRIAALAEAARVLRPGGVYLFSSHNRNYASALSGPRLALGGGPIGALRGVSRWLRQMRNHQRVGPMRRVEPGYALLNDTGHDYALLHYYVDIDTQERQLAAAGLQLVEVLDGDGSRVGLGDRGSDDLVLLYVARRRGD